MTKSEKQYEIMEQITDLLNEESDIFEEAVEELDSWNGYLGDDRYYCMDEFNDIYYSCSPLEIAEAVCGGDFNPNDEYFRITWSGAESTDFKDYYDVCDVDDVAQSLISYASNLCLDSRLEELIDDYENAEDDDATVYEVEYIERDEDGNAVEKTAILGGDGMKESLLILINRDCFVKIISCEEISELVEDEACTYQGYDVWFLGVSDEVHEALTRTPKTEEETPTEATPNEDAPTTEDDADGVTHLVITSTRMIEA